ncbi:MAG: hypothetical protein M3P98_02130 [bacterium]|nr:hypothetical protein [bacterium]
MKITKYEHSCLDITEGRTRLVIDPGVFSKTVGDITLEFFGKDHALIDQSVPIAQNVGALVNAKFYTPGDSWTECPKPHEWLGMPSHAPWAKHVDVMDFLRQSQAKNLFPMHNGFLNDNGLALYERLLSGGADLTGKTFKYLAPGKSLEI